MVLRALEKEWKDHSTNNVSQTLGLDCRPTNLRFQDCSISFMFCPLYQSPYIPLLRIPSLCRLKNAAADVPC
ncbi:Uncharacterized protein TCM_034965 [Theobroma cacao]|uniref:Uncharacterized protein n=1 Tax=Theobroma cacao TaxID=3641 RepID=A0A061FFH4_THECC|nr:Uncharacterized protein TCM_034965 [Theobroma cacao]